ncbi:FliO/MopB family protein [Solirubrobacter deserti]|uniref:Flagellar biosynthetic protein FliO n=1 Tax=Solirubrobacter deserti TaxID=2282478 RepID=A0ABT4RMF1_9ACTN|nr:flagellar biosynthetic protein FliO [Solirubrobacter deserti]MDA0139747.1 flagellar biosynthetic protein FliO [Solirubrobacter deserti]
MRTPSSILAAVTTATLACGLTAPVAFAADGEGTKLNLAEETGSAATGASATSGGSIVRTIVGLAIVLAVIYGLHWVLKQVKTSKDADESGDSLETVATLNLAPNRSLHLVRVGGEIVLLGAAEHQITPIRRYSEAEATALGLLEPPAMTLASLEAETAAPKGLMNLIRAKAVAK